MKTLQEVKEEYATSLNDVYSSYTWQSLLSSNSSRNMEHHYDSVMILYALEVAKQTQINCAENAKITQWNEGYGVIHKVDKESIIKQSNIPKL